MSIETDSFYGCTKLTNVTLPESVTSIENTSFENCSDKLTMTVTDGSYAEQWATENGFKTKVIKIE